uniref:Uncharacterized protein n=1 Tax=Plectus sambesii TaxID=2011161 RepID=A0A914V986_9BILA
MRAQLVRPARARACAQETIHSRRFVVAARVRPQWLSTPTVDGGDVKCPAHEFGPNSGRKIRSDGAICRSRPDGQCVAGGQLAPPPPAHRLEEGQP